MIYAVSNSLTEDKASPKQALHKVLSFAQCGSQNASVKSQQMELKCLPCLHEILSAELQQPYKIFRHHGKYQ